MAEISGAVSNAIERASVFAEDGVVLNHSSGRLRRHEHYISYFEADMFFGKAKKTAPAVTAQAGTPAVFWGASDRIICCSGIAGEGNEFNVTSHPKLQDGGYVATLEISVPDENQGVLVHVFYSGHWSFAVSPSSEASDDLPAWPVVREWGTMNAHSETLRIYCPKNASLKVVDRIGANS